MNLSFEASFKYKQIFDQAQFSAELFLETDQNILIPYFPGNFLAEKFIFDDALDQDAP